jgi:hypothetical protein
MNLFSFDPPFPFPGPRNRLRGRKQLMRAVERVEAGPGLSLPS